MTPTLGIIKFIMEHRIANETNAGKAATERTKTPILFGNTELQDKFEVSSYTMNIVEVENEEGEKMCNFPGNIAPEGLFYSPFYEVKLKELNDELQTSSPKRINFVPSGASVETASTNFYDTKTGVETVETVWLITLQTPINYDLLIGQPFCIYDILAEKTYRGFLDGMEGRNIRILSKTEIDSNGLTGKADGSDGKSRYIISFLTENVPDYAEFIPSTQKLVWRGPKKMSDLSSDSPLYNMPFTNGRLYIHKNINVHVRRQDPHGEYKLFRPSLSNPLRRFQIEGEPKLDFEYMQYIIDSMVDAC